MFEYFFTKIAELDIDQSYTYIKDTLEAPSAAENLLDNCTTNISQSNNNFNFGI